MHAIESGLSSESENLPAATTYLITLLRVNHDALRGPAAAAAGALGRARRRVGLLVPTAVPVHDDDAHDGQVLGFA